MGKGARVHYCSPSLTLLPEHLPAPCPLWKKNCLPGNWSLLPERLEITATGYKRMKKPSKSRIKEIQDIFGHLRLKSSPVNNFCSVLCYVASVRTASVTPWTVARQAPLFMGFSRQEYWSGMPCHLPGDLLNPGIEPKSLAASALAGRFFTTSITC